MRNSVLLLVLGFVLLVMVTAGDSRQIVPDGTIGVWRSHNLQESYKISTGVTALGKPGSPRLHTERREVLILPQYYGNLVGITGNGSQSVFWYQDGDGVIRNAVIEDATSRRVEIKYGAISNLVKRRIK